MYKVMIVDDEIAIREKIPKLVRFEQYGFSVVATARNGREALEKLPEYGPDLILLDVRMPVLDGIGFLEELRKGDYAHVRVIILSGYSDFKYAQKAVSYGVKAYLTKPIDEDETHECLERIREELSASGAEKRRKAVRRDANALRGILSGTGPAAGFEGYLLVHCVVLSFQVDYEEANAYEIINSCLTGLVEHPEDGLIRIRGSVFSYLVPCGAPDKWDCGAFAAALEAKLRARALECAILFDPEVLMRPGDCFRRDFSSHLYRMLTDLFYGKPGVPVYGEDRYGGDGPCFSMEEEVADGLRESVLALEKERAVALLNGLLRSVEGAEIHLDQIQELNYRLYYLLLGMMPSRDEGEEPILQPPEWLEHPVFVTLERWKDLQREQLLEAFAYLESSRRMSSLGVGASLLEYIHRNYDSPLTLKQVAEKFYMNPAYLGRMFQKAAGVSFKQYVNNLRIAKAKRLLRQTNKLIYEVAELAGFSESKYFISLFTREVGISPTEYRKEVG